MSEINVGGRKQVTASTKTQAGSIASWAKNKGHVVYTDLKSYPVMFSVQDEKSKMSAAGKHQIMFTVYGKAADSVNIWLNSYSMHRGSEPKAKVDIKLQNLGKISENPRGGATLTLKEGVVPSDKDLDTLFQVCRTNLPERKATGKARTTTKKAKTTTKTKAIKAKKISKEKVKQHTKIKKAA